MVHTEEGMRLSKCSEVTLGKTWASQRKPGGDDWKNDSGHVEHGRRQG